MRCGIQKINFYLLILAFSFVGLNAQDFTRDNDGRLTGYAFPFSEVSADSGNLIQVNYTIEVTGRLTALDARIPGLFLTRPEDLGIVLGTGFSGDVLAVEALQPLALEVDTAGAPEPTVTWEFGSNWSSRGLIVETGHAFSLDSIRYTDNNQSFTVTVENEYGSESFTFSLDVGNGPYPEGLTIYDLETLISGSGWQVTTADTPAGLDEAILLEEVPVGYGTYPLELVTGSEGVLSFWVKTVGDALLYNTVSSAQQQAEWTLVEWELSASTGSVSFYPRTISAGDAIFMAGIQFQKADSRVGIDLLPSENGRVTVDGGGTLFEAGETIQLIPVAEEGYRFLAWTADASGSDVPFSLAMPYSRAVGATFVRDGPFGGLGGDHLDFQSGGDAPWTMQMDDLPQDSIIAARSGAINDNQESWIETTVEGPGTLTFQRKISSSYGDYLEFHIGETWESGWGWEDRWTGGGRWSSEAGWKSESFRIEAEGPQILRWIYTKDESVADLEDAGFLANIQFEADAGRTFADWAAALPEGARSFDDEPFGSGIPNGVLFALGMTPENPELERLPVVDLLSQGGEDYISIVFTRSTEVGGIEYILKGGSALGALPEVPFSTEILGNPGAGLEQVRMRQDSSITGEPRWFLNMEVREVVE